MALIKCTECGKEVSDKASSCPGCGAPIAEAISVGNNDALDEIPRLSLFSRIALSFQSPFAYIAAFLAGGYSLLAIPFADLGVKDAAIILVAAICCGALLHFILFHLPAIAFGQIASGGVFKKFVGIIGILIFGFTVYGVWFLVDETITKANEDQASTQPGKTSPAPNSRAEAVELAKYIIAEDTKKLKQLNANSVPKIQQDEEYRRNMEDPSYNCRLCKNLVEKGKDMDGNVYDPNSTGKIKQIYEYCHTDDALKGCKTYHSITWNL